jgi:Flp pilus assembly protein TadD
MRAWTDEGIARASAGQSAAAVQAFEAALAFDPESADLHRNLANALLAAGNAVGAAQQAREALRLRPGDPVAQEVLELSGTKR